MKEKIFCKNCRHFYKVKSTYNDCQNNNNLKIIIAKGSGYKSTELKKDFFEINKNNNCKWFKKNRIRDYLRKKIIDFANNPSIL